LELFTLILLTWRIWWTPNNASRWPMGFNSAFEGFKSNIGLVWSIEMINSVHECACRGLFCVCVCVCMCVCRICKGATFCYSKRGGEEFSVLIKRMKIVWINVINSSLTWNLLLVETNGSPNCLNVLVLFFN